MSQQDEKILPEAESSAASAAVDSGIDTGPPSDLEQGTHSVAPPSVHGNNLLQAENEADEASDGTDEG
jgi:hypothetical protein